ncbi:hypothetical protein Afil01_53630 [Actinorhabdospora filicis]|uniref:Uncharacterized protein n=1 Tax=Actinorhabdospora filicis TaxID=1785913 RepID=A0A9W6WCG0_9ACTN|nr:hypothetical protein [Actinorhabdospora filicis]GLZ80556.1 hypothetical protein Afil01_53630 [Actinorhabdospora filicis]
MYQPQPDVPARPASAGQGVAAVGVAGVGLLVEVFAAFTLMSWRDSTGKSGFSEPSVVGIMYGYLAWGMLMVILLMLGAVLVLRGRPGGRVLVYVTGSLALAGVLGCGGMSGVIVGGPYGSSSDWPPQWIAMIALAGSVIALVALIFAFVALGRRTTTLWLKPPPPPPAPYYQVPYTWNG